MDRESFLLLIALVLAVIAAVVDVQQHRIPNWLTYPGIVLGLSLRGFLLGWKGLASAVEGCLVAGGIMLIFYIVRAMGAGDVKLMGALGALIGPHHAVVVLVATGIFGGLLGICFAFYRGKIGATLKNLGTVLRFHASAGLQAHPDLNLDNPAALRMPYGLAIALGMFYAFLAIWWR